LGRLVIILLLLAAGCVIFATIGDVGLTWDEAIYLGTAARLALYLGDITRADWYDFDFDAMSRGFKAEYASYPRPWGSFSRPVIDFFWYKEHRDHPPLGKALMALSLLCFNPFLPTLWAARIATMLEFLVLMFCTYLLAAYFAGEKAGIFAALFLFLMPRVFAHAHIAALDVCVTMFWMAAVTAFVRLRGWLGALVAGVLYGFATLSKISAAPIPLALFLYLLFNREEKIWRVWAMSLVGLMVFFLCWQAILYDFPKRIIEYIVVVAQRAHVPTYYLGTQYSDTNPPWHYPLLMTVLTLPVGTMAVALLGLLRRGIGKGVALILANLIVIYGIACLKFTPKYDGVRLFLQAFPFIACLAGFGMERLWLWLWSKRPSLAPIAAGIVLLPQAISVGCLHPYQLSYYNILCGGCKGAYYRGMETTYWGDTLTKNALTFLDENCEEGARVAFFPVGSAVPLVHQRVTGFLRKDIVPVGLDEEFDYLVLITRQGMFNSKAWRYFRGGEPLWALYLDGVPVCMIFRRMEEK